MSAQQIRAILAAKAWRNAPAVFPVNTPKLYRVESANHRFQYETQSANIASIGFNVRTA